MRKLVLCLSILILSPSQPFPATAQENSEEYSPYTTESEIPPSFGTVPGIYYDPDAGLSPSLSQMLGAKESGSIYENPALDSDYNSSRAWKTGSTPDSIIKVGDIENDPELEGVIEIKNLSLRKIAQSGGADIETVPLRDIGLLNSMTLNEFLETFPQYQNSQITNFPILNTINSEPRIDANSNQTGVLSNSETNLVRQLGDEPTLENISILDLARGDWGDSLTAAEQSTLISVLEQYPELSEVPVDKFLSSDNRPNTSIVNEAEKEVDQRDGDISTSELLTAIPELGNVPLSALPIDGLLVGDLEGLADLTLDKIPDIDNRYLSEVGNLSENSDSMLGDDFAFMLLRGDLFGRLDIPFAGDIETPIDYVLTGGTRNQIFKPEPCFESGCKHFEVVDVFSGVAEQLNGIGRVQGKAWIQGSSQAVPGGKGVLALVNGGKERTGVSVWDTSSHVKISLEDIDEGGDGEPATARIWLDFQICVYSSFGEQCTPHFLSFATPWKVKEKGVMVIFSRSSPSELIEYGWEKALVRPSD